MINDLDTSDSCRLTPKDAHEWIAMWRKEMRELIIYRNEHHPLPSSVDFAIQMRIDVCRVSIHQTRRELEGDL